MRTRPSARGLRLRRGFGVRQPLSVTLSENDVDGADNCCGIGEHVTLRHHVHRLQVAERGRADLAAIGLVAAVADQIDAEFALRAFGGDIDFARGDVETRSEEHTSELQSLMRISYSVFCLNKKNN